MANVETSQTRYQAEITYRLDLDVDEETYRMIQQAVEDGLSPTEAWEELVAKKEIAFGNLQVEEFTELGAYTKSSSI